MNYYHYPRIILRFPFLIQVVYGFNWLNQQRKWIVYKSLNAHLKKLSNGSVVADVGCGEGQYLIPLAKRYPHLNFIALDNHFPNIEFINIYKSHLKLNNITTMFTDLENVKWQSKPELAWCIGVLQYIQNDDIAIAMMAECNQLLIYQPINNKIETNFYKWVLKKFSSYDYEQKRQHIYSKIELVEKLKIYFTIIMNSEHYGKIGRISHEWHTGLQNIIFHANWFLKLPALTILLLTYPLVLLCMILDARSRVNNGNGLFIHAISKKVYH